MTKEDVLQKVTDYCNEKSYTEETLTGEFKEKFSDFFAKKYPETDADDAAAIADLQFNLNTAFSAASRGLTSKQKAFSEKENEYKRQIQELNDLLGNKKEEQPTQVSIPQQLQDELDELKQFKLVQTKREKFKEIVELAKKDVRSDLHKSLENYAEDFDVNVDETNEEQAKKLSARFMRIFKDTLGDMKPLSPKQTQKRDEEVLCSIPKIKL